MFVIVTRKLKEVSAAAIEIAVDMAVAIGHTVAELVRGILYSVLQLRRERWVAHPVWLRGGNAGAIIGSCSIHGSRSITR